MPNYSRLLKTAQRLIGNSGRSVVLNNLGVVPDDPSKPWGDDSSKSSVPTGTQTVIGTFVEIESVERLGISIRNQAYFSMIDKVLMVAAPDVENFDFEEIDQVVDDAVNYKVRFIEKLKPGDITLMYFLGVSK